MTAYYNENDKKAAAWLRELIKQGAIAPGEVDERSIVDVSAADLAGFTQCHFFAGIGGWSYALRLAGWPDSRPVWTGSCPCQPFSQAGRGLGTADERHLWPEWKRLIRLRRPPTVFGEQVASPAALAWLDAVQADLEGGRYAFAAFDLPAASAGAPHIRQRIYFVADTAIQGCNGVSVRGDEKVGRRFAEDIPEAAWRGAACELADSELPRTTRLRAQCGQGAAQGGIRCGSSDCGELGNASGAGLPLGSLSADGGRVVRIEGTAVGEAEPVRGLWSGADWIACRDGKYRPVEPGTFPLAHGAPERVGRLRGYGNAIVAPLAAEFIAAYLDV